MEQVSASLTANDPELMGLIGVIASRLLENIPESNAGSDMRREALLERALMYAAQAEQQIAHQNARIEYLEGLSSTDELTGLFNRRGFTDQLKRALANARRHDHTGALIYCDLDNLKMINDTLGHCAGDAVLRHVGEIAVSSLREVDTVARLAGDEFAMLIEQASLADGRKRATTLQWTIEATPCTFRDLSIPVRISLGTIGYDKDDTPEELIRRADTEMYEVKRARKRSPTQIVVRKKAG